MNRIVRKILAAIFFLILSAAVIFVYYQMFQKSADQNNDQPSKSTRAGMRYTPEPSTEPIRLSNEDSPEIKVTPEPSAQPVENREISGTVKDYDMKNPVKNLSIMLLGKESDYYAEVFSDDKGSFKFSNIPANAGDTFSIGLGTNNYYMEQIEVMIGDSIDLMPVESAILQGHIIDEASKLPIKDVMVQVTVEWEKKELLFSCVSEHRGDYNVNGLPPGRVVSVVTTSPNYIPEEHVDNTTILQLKRSVAVTFRITMIAGTPLKGSAVDQNGDPVVGALVFLIVEGDEYDAQRSQYLREKFGYITYTDQNGYFTLYPPPNNNLSYKIAVYREGFALELVSISEDLNVVMEEGDDGHPLMQQ